MRWDQEELEMRLPAKGHRPVADTIIGPGRRFRHPAVQAEIERRVAIYSQQVEQTGRINWLPYRGSGE
jgi:hypothetical protein